MAEEKTIITDPAKAADQARLNEQCYLIANMDLITKFDNAIADPKPRKNLILTKNEVNPDDLIGLISKSNGSEELLRATPAQLAYLVPQIRLFRTAGDDADIPIYFSEYSVVPTIAGSSPSPSNEVFRDRVVGAGAGLTDFNFSFDNENPGAISFTAETTIHFASIVDLVHGPYIELLIPPMGTSTPPNPTGNTAEKIKQLKKQIEELKSAQKNNSNSLKAQKAKRNKQLKMGSATRLRAVLGWATPSLTQRDLLPMNDLKFYEAVKNTRVTLMLEMTRHQITFGQEGQITLKIDYAASIESAFSAAESDIFPPAGASKILERTRSEKMYYADLPSKSTRDYGGRNTMLGKILWDASRTNVADPSTTRQLLNSLSGVTPTIKLYDAPGAKFLIYEHRLLADLKLFRKQQLLYTLMSSSGSGGEVGEHEIRDVKEAIKNYGLVLSKIRTNSAKSKQSGILTSLLESGKIYTLYIEADTYRDLVIGATKDADDEDGVKTSKELAATRRMTSKRHPVGQRSTSKQMRQLIGNSEQKGPIDSVVSAEDSDKRDEAKKKALSESLNPANSLPTDGQAKVQYVLFGDLLDTVLSHASFSEKQKLILSNVAVPFQDNKKISLADVPISMNQFQVWFLDKVVKPQRKVFPLRHFIKSVFRHLLEPAFNQCDFGETAIFETTIFALEEDEKNNTVIGKSSSILRSDSDRQWADAGQSSQTSEYMILYSGKKTKTRVRTPEEDIAAGTYHLFLGSDRGLVKSFSFSQQENQHLHSQNVAAAAAGSDPMGPLALPQDCSLTLVGNSLFRPGQYIYINADLALTREKADALKLGGYYRVASVSNTITSSGFTTDVKCIWESKPAAKKR